MLPPCDACAHTATSLVKRWRAAPGAAVGVAAHRAERGWWRGGATAGELYSHPPPGAPSASPSLRADDLFDLASLTKPVTALVAQRLAEQGRLALSDPLSTHLPLVKDSPSGPLPLRAFLTHRAGLIAHVPFYVERADATQLDREAILRRAADHRRPECAGDPPEAGFSPVYCDLGYMLVGAALEACTGCQLDALVAREVAAPLGLTLGSARALASSGRRFVPSEDTAWRGGVLVGEVHDDNAWVLAGRASAGHAGLFGDVAAVTRLGEAILDTLHGRRSDWLAPASMAELLELPPGGTHTAGFDTRSPAPPPHGPSMGHRFGPRTFGHLGFTGTSLWMDPDRDWVGVLLSHRVHPSREHIAIRRGRPAIYDAIAQILEAGAE